MVLGGRVRPERAVGTRPAPAEAARPRPLTSFSAAEPGLAARGPQGPRCVLVTAPRPRPSWCRADAQVLQASGCPSREAASMRHRMRVSPVYAGQQWTTLGETFERSEETDEALGLWSGRSRRRPRRTRFRRASALTATRRGRFELTLFPEVSQVERSPVRIAKSSREDGVSTAGGPSTFCTLPLPKPADRIRCHYSTEASSGSS